MDPRASRLVLLHAEPSAMSTRSTITSGLVATACLLALGSCRDDPGPTSSPGSSGMSSDATAGAATTLADGPVADSTGDPADSACIDDYHGNQSHAAAVDLALDTTDNAVIVLGDGLALNPPEAGSDELVVCSETSSDFFVLSTECPGYLAVEARELEGGGVPDLLLHDGSIAPGSPPLGQALGTWNGFFLKPLQRGLDSGSYVIEVRLRSGLDLQRYSLTVAWLPDSPCPP
jgi:hypothetical protein